MKTGKELNIQDKWYENTIINKETATKYNLTVEYTPSDSVQIQKLINYCVVRYLKTDKVKNLQDNIKRWKYTNQTVKEYNSQFANHKFNLTAFSNMKEELIELLFE